MASFVVEVLCNDLVRGLLQSRIESSQLLVHVGEIGFAREALSPKMEEHVTSA